MEAKDRIDSENWMRSGVTVNELLQKCSPDSQYFSISNQLSDQVEWKDSCFMDYEMRSQDFMSESIPVSNRSSSIIGGHNNQTHVSIEMDAQCNRILHDSSSSNWDPNAMLKNLSFLEVKIHQLQDMVHFIVGRKYQDGNGTDEDEVTAQQKLINADLKSIIAQLISTAGSLLPSATRNILTENATIDPLNGILFTSGILPQCSGGTTCPELSKQADSVAKNNPVTEQNIMMDEHEMKDEEDAEEGEHLPPGSYEILQLEKEEILAPHTHFCTICGKGFKRDANLRMHMRGHGDEYKSPAALAKPAKECNLEPVLIKRYSCPYSGCKRNKDHKKFQPLKTMLCVKNHYKRSHCDKSFTCSRCNNKKFSVIADLKTHEKHCGRDKWLCSCGTTFSRKDKLFGHIALFQGHTPANPLDEKIIVLPEPRSDIPNKVIGVELNVSYDLSVSGDLMNYDYNVDDPVGCFSPLDFDPCNMTGFEEFTRAAFDDSDGSFAFLMPGTYGYDQKSEEEEENEFK